MAINEVTSIDVKTLPPFKRLIMTIGELPTSYLESMTYAELLMWFCNFLQEKVLPTINNNADALQEVITYLENLDLQDEIDNKLDEMAEDGTLQEIIAEYLNANALWCFDTVAEMKTATNLINGSYAKTLGYYAKNDGGTALYKIRNITNNDTVNEMTIISLNDNNLIAELITNKDTYNVLQLGLKDNEENITQNKEKLNNILKDNIKLIFPKNHNIYIDVIEIKNNFIEITGGGNIYGSFKCSGTTLKEEFNIHDVNLYGYNNQPCVEMSYLIRSSIKNCKFYNCDKAIMYDSVDVAQNVSRIVIDNNYFNNINYALYGVKPLNGTQPLIVADIHFTNNIIEACKIQHLHLEGFDGGIISNNTMFFLSYLQQPANKTNNIYIDFCNWTIISNNNLFEAGTEAILIEHGQAVRIIGNNIAWSGQRQQTAGIRITNHDISNLKFNISTISNNDVMYASGNAIKCDNNVGHINITSNNLFGNSSQSAEAYYYGNETYVNGMTGIDCDNTTTRIIVENNNLAQNNISNLSEYAITNDNIKLDHNDSNLRYEEKTVSISTNTSSSSYGTINLTHTPIAIIPLYEQTGYLASSVWQYNASDNTIQVRNLPDTTATTRTYKFRSYYIDNSN